MEKTYEFPLDDLELLRPDQEDDGEGEGEGEEGEGQPGDSKPGQGQGQGQGDDDNDEVDAADISGDDVDDDQFNDEMEKIFKDMEDILDEKEEVTPEEIEAAAAKKPSKPTKGGEQNRSRSRVVTPVPEFSWEEILRRLLTVPSDVEKTYQKTSRRAASTMTAAGAGEPAYLPPGERAEEENFKVLFVFDSSGSMSHAIKPALAESQNLIKQNYENIEGVVGVVFFADKAEYWAANLSRDIVYRVANLSQIAEAPDSTNTFPISKLFSSALSGGTALTKSMTANLLNAAGQGYNILLFTDTDVFNDNSNLANFKAVWKSHSQQLFVLLDSQYSFEFALKRLGLVNHPHFGIIGP